MKQQFNSVIKQMRALAQEKVNNRAKGICGLERDKRTQKSRCDLDDSPNLTVFLLRAFNKRKTDILSMYLTLICHTDTSRSASHL